MDPSIRHLLGQPMMGNLPGQSPAMGLSPMGQQPMSQLSPQQGMAQLQDLTQLINQKHAELQGHLKAHAKLREQLGI